MESRYSICLLLASAAMALTQAPMSDRDVKGLSQLLANGSAVDRRAAAAELGRRGVKAGAALPVLLRAFKYDEDLDVRRNAALALAAVDPVNSEVLSSLRDGLVNPKTRVRLASADALGNAGAPAWVAADALVRRVARDLSLEVRAASLTALGIIGRQREDAIWSIVERLSSDDPKLQLAACRALGRIGVKAVAALPHLQQLGSNVKGKSPELEDAVKDAVAAIASAAPPPKSSPKRPKDKDFDVSPEMEELKKLMTSKNPTVRLAAVEEAGRRPEDAESAVLRIGRLLEEDEDPRVAAAAARTLGIMGAPAARVLISLRRALPKREVNVRRSAAVALGRIGPGAWGAVNDLTLAWVSDDDASVRQDAAAALRRLQIPSKDVASSVAEILTTREPEAEARLRACYAIAALGSPGVDDDALTALESALKDESASVRCAAAGAIGVVGSANPRTIEALTVALQGGDPKVRNTAGEALERLDPGALTRSGSGSRAESRTAEPEDGNKVADAEPADAASRPVKDAELLREKIADLLRGMGGASEPTAVITGGRLRVDLTLQHARFDAADAHRDAVAIAMKLLLELPELGSVEFRILSQKGIPLANATIHHERARAFFERFEDPFERRRMQDWWGPLTGM